MEGLPLVALAQNINLRVCFDGPLFSEFLSGTNEGLELHRPIGDSH